MTHTTGRAIRRWLVRVGATVVVAGTATSLAPGAAASAGVQPYVQSSTVSKPVLNGGERATQTITLNAPAPAGGVNVRLYGDRIYNFSTGGSVVVPQGRRSVTFPFHVGAPAETFTLNLSAQTAGYDLKAVTQLEVRALDPRKQAVTGFRVSVPEAVAGDTVAGTVQLLRPAPSGGLAVALWPNSTYEYGALGFEELWALVPAGRTTVTVPLHASAERSVVAKPTADLGTSRASGDTVVTPDALSFNGPAAVGASNDWLLGIGRAGHPGGAVVSLTSDTPGITVPATVTVPADRVTTAFPVTVAADVPAWTIFNVTAVWNGTTVTTQFFTYPA
ncbi:hypothetical protein ACFO1B_21740 [Dactylosporangium siamense]|uniref:Uncharacterized protein n=1 Tax=Dactylosporangium siamense TaxID=685454 RepID=A0A919PW22_9ACTN|nr:hypothetical protein [Dactylosporangium siamense]GIG50732.1 hypothetical protein Dsi01nite_087730 [Dactylosporangium siamense]